MAFTEHELPEVAIDVTDQATMDTFGLTALTANGIADDTAALNLIKADASVTNWYFPSGKTCLLYGISVPEHVKAVYGSGILKTIAKDIPKPYGIIRQTDTHTGYVIDGLTLIDTTESFAQNETGEYGFIQISGNGSQQNIEIRNCIIDGTNSPLYTAGSYPRPRNGITVWTDTGSLVHNFWIHNNDIINIAGAGIELLHRGAIDVDGSDERLYNTRVSSNNIGKEYCSESHEDLATLSA